MVDPADTSPATPWGPTLGGAHWDMTRLATFGDRFIGYVIDAIVLLPVTLLGIWLRDPRVERSTPGAGAQHFVMDHLPWWGTFLLAVPVCIYVVTTIAVWGATIGQRSQGLKVVDRATGAPVHWRAATIRWGIVSGPVLLVSMAVPGLRIVASVWILIVLGWMFADRDRQGLHDKGAGVVVIWDLARIPAPPVP